MKCQIYDENGEPILIINHKETYIFNAEIKE